MIVRVRVCINIYRIYVQTIEEEERFGGRGSEGHRLCLHKRRMVVSVHIIIYCVSACTRIYIIFRADATATTFIIAFARKIIFALLIWQRTRTHTRVHTITHKRKHEESSPNRTTQCVRVVVVVVDSSVATTRMTRPLWLGTHDRWWWCRILYCVHRTRRNLHSY